MSHNPAWLINKHPKDLKAQIKELTSKGYAVTVQDATTAQLMRRKQFSCLIATLSFFFFGIGFFLYLFYFLAQRDETIYLDLSTQEYDSNWKAKQDLANKRWRMGAVALIAAPFTIIAVATFFYGLNDEVTSTPSDAVAQPIAYTIVSGSTDSPIINQAVVIAPEDATEENVRALVAKWQSDYASKSIVGIAVFTDAEMATYFEDAVSGVPAAVSDRYDVSYTAQWNKNENTGLNRLNFYPQGLGGTTTSVDF